MGSKEALFFICLNSLPKFLERFKCGFYDYLYMAKVVLNFFDLL